MSDHQHNIESFSNIESIIQAAGSYVGPSDDLRPRTMEAARERSKLAEQAKQTLAHVMFAIGLMALLITPVIDQVRKLPVPAGLSSHEVQLRAVNQARSSGDYHWTMVEIFSELRSNRDGS